MTSDGFEEGAYEAVLDGVASIMRDRRPENCMMWNLGWRMEILGKLLAGRVLEFGSILTTCNLQPLWQMINIIYSIRSWLGEATTKTAFIHCLHPQRLVMFLRCLFVGAEGRTSCRACRADQGQGINADRDNCATCPSGEYSIFGVCQECVRPAAHLRARGCT